MVVHGDAAMRVVEHGLVDFIGAAGDRFHQSTSPDDSIELQWYVVAFQFVDDELFAEREFVDDVFKLAEFLCRVADGAQQNGLLVVLDGNLRGSGARVDG